MAYLDTICIKDKLTMVKSNDAYETLKSLERITFITNKELLVEDCYPERRQKHLVRDIMITVQNTKILEKAEELFDEKDLIIIDKELDINFGDPAFAVLRVEYADEGLSNADISQIRNLLYQALLSN
jgi:hypothetical protein